MIDLQLLRARLNRCLSGTANHRAFDVPIFPRHDIHVVVELDVGLDAIADLLSAHALVTVAGGCVPVAQDIVAAILPDEGMLLITAVVVEVPHSVIDLQAT